LTRPSTNVAVVHDYFAIRGGGERMALTTAKAFGAKLVCAYWVPASFPRDMFPHDFEELGKPWMAERMATRLLALSYRFSLARGRMRSFDTRLFSGVAAVLAAPEREAPGRNVFYCHSPPRFIYDQRQSYVTSRGRAWAPLIGAGIDGFSVLYDRAVERMHVVVANSKNVQGRIRKYLGHDSVVVYPPCDTDRFEWISEQGYYLSTARLHSLKRVDRIIDAFLTMPDKPLVVVSDGIEAQSLRRRAAGAANISFTGSVDDATMRRLIGEAIATVYVPVDEDFGMSPVESMAAGKPVIGVAEGGLLETVVPGETGIFVNPGCTGADIAEAVRALDAPAAARMRAACEARAELFSRPRFVAGMADILGVPPV